MYPIENMINFDICLDLKSSEKEAKERKDSSAEKPQKDDKKDACKHYKDVEKEQLFFLVEEKGMSVRAAAQKLSINVRTVQGWISKNNKDPQKYIQWADENTNSVVLEDMLDALKSLDIFKSLEVTSISLLDKSVG